MKLNNRRYIGNKFKLLPFIDKILQTCNVEFTSVADIFAGTGVVAEYFLNNNKKVIINDILEILGSVGHVKQFSIDYKHFNSGKTKLDNHQEILYLCKL